MERNIVRMVTMLKGIIDQLLHFLKEVYFSYQSRTSLDCKRENGVITGAV